MLKTIMSVEEVAEYLSFSPKKIYRLVETNKIPASKIGRQYRFLKDVIDGWLVGKSLSIKPDWGQRLDSILARMRAKTSKLNISASDIEKEITMVRKAKRENT